MSDVEPRLHQAMLQAVDRLDLPLTVRQVNELATVTANIFDPPPSPLPIVAVADLTNQQLAVLLGLAGGERICDTARRLCVSENTIRTHRRALFKKLAVSTSGHAVARAKDLGLLRIASPLPLPGHGPVGVAP